jgi:hypothetical protein
MNYSTTLPHACTHKHSHTGERKGEQEAERERGGESVRAQEREFIPKWANVLF